MAKKVSKIDHMAESASKKEAGERYFEAVGRRKTAVARVRLFKATHVKTTNVHILVNGKSIDKYFPLKKHADLARAPFKVLKNNNFEVLVKANGGGLGAQAEAARLGISRALTIFDEAFRPKFKAFGFLTRDPRMVERKKVGSRKARRPQQWRKR